MVTLATKVVAMVLLGWMGPGSAAPLPLAAVAQGQEAPPIQAKALDGTPVDLARWRGQVVLVDFWATWCEPCRLSLPRYEALQRKLGDQGLRTVTISVDEEVETLKRFVAALQLTLPVVHDPEGQHAGRYQPPKMPTAYLVGRDGKIAYVRQGFVAGDEKVVEAAVRKALAQPMP